MTPPSTVEIPPRPPDALATPLGRLRDRLREVAPGRTDGLAGHRLELEALRAEADRLGRRGSGRALGRLALMTEVWECLAVESPGSAQQAASFCVRALDQLAGDACDDDDEVASRILQESSASWSDYLGLIDPSDGGMPGDLDDPPAAPTPLLAIDPATLVRMLTGVAATPPDTEPEPPRRSTPLPAAGPAPREGEGAPGPRPAPPTPTGPIAIAPEPSSRAEPAIAPAAGRKVERVLDIDPECREAFLSEATDLFERIETHVFDLGRGPGHADTLDELGRCFHTLKGAAGSVGLIELASRIHSLEEGLETAHGAISDELLDQLHRSLSHLENVLASLRQGSSPAPAASTPTTSGAGMGVDPDASVEGRPAGDDAPTAAGPADGPVRVSSARMDELMDLASELIMRRGLWAAQADRLKEFAALIRTCRDGLLGRLDRLNEFGITRAARVSARGVAAGPANHGVDPTSDFATDVLRLAEQAEDLVVLTEAAQAQALPLADDSDTLARLTLQLWEALQSIRIVPVRGLFQRLARVAHDAARIEGRDVEVVMIGEETGLDRAVQDKAFEPLLHIVRNAIGHGIEHPDDRVKGGKPAAGRVTLAASREGNTLVLSVEDDGRGLDYDAIAAKGRRLALIAPDEAPGPERLGALIFLSGFSTRQEANAIAGRGVGMDVVAQEVRRLHGTIDLTSKPGLGTRMTLRLPARLALEKAMIVRVAGLAFAIPIVQIELAQAFEPADVDGTGGDATVHVRDHRVPLIVAREALGFSTTPPASCPKLLLVRADGEPMALLCDAIEGTRELVIKPLGPLLAGHPVISGTSLSLTGDIIFVLNPSGLLRRSRDGRADAVESRRETATRTAPVLVVDDSISVRRVVTRQLRALGLEVEEVSNGVEALGRLSSRAYSMVLTDLEMPRMDGFELVAEIRRLPALAGLPVIVASTESRPATRRRALALGARAFLAKPIDQDELARVAAALLDRAIGPPLD